MSKLLKIIRSGLVVTTIFDNWYELMIKYFLFRLGFNTRPIAKISECSLDLDVAIALTLGIRDGVIRQYKCSSGKFFMGNWVYDPENKLWIRLDKNQVKFKRMTLSLLEIFDYGEYDELNVNGKTVVDIGAYVGDSAIYFALKGARGVIAVEPHPGAYVEMIENIKLNNLEQFIIPINAGLTSKFDKICVNNVDISATATTLHSKNENSCEITVPTVTLDDLLKRFAVDANSVLKMDCEGCEFDVIINDYQHVKLFKELIIEYHSSPGKLLKILNNDYKCKMKGDKKVGIMYCVQN
jgi:FkbM family methyltransferase